MLIEHRGHIRPTKGLPQGKRLWISARMLRVIKQQDEHRAAKGRRRTYSVQRALINVGQNPAAYSHVNCANSVTAYVRGVYAGKLHIVLTKRP